MASLPKIAIAQNRIIVTKDSDFFDRYLLKGAPPKVLLLEIGNTKNTILFRFIEEQIPRVKIFFIKTTPRINKVTNNTIVTIVPTDISICPRELSLLILSQRSFI